MSRIWWAIGDSITQGFPLNSGPSYRPYVANRRQWGLVGSRTDWIGLRHDGWGGYTAQDAVTNFPTWLTTVQGQAMPPTDVTVWLGINDAVAAVPGATWKANMETLAGQIAAAYPSANRWVIKLPLSPVVGLQPFVNAYNAYITAGTLAGYTGVIDLAAVTYPAGSYEADNIHYEPTGDLINAFVFLSTMGA